MTPPVWLLWESESVASPGVEWTPSNISDLVVWLDADDTAFSNNDPVDSWTNKGTGGNTAQTDSTKRPIFRTNLLNSKPGIDFDGVNDCLQIDSLALDTYTTVFIVAQTTTNKPFFIEHSENAVNQSGFWWYGKGGSGAAAYRTNRSGSQNSYLGTVGWFGSAAAQAALVIDAIASTPNPMGKIYQNGYLQADGGAASTSAVSNSSVSTVLNIGSRNNGDALEMDGNLHELIIYNKPLAQADREKVEGYLAHKWALEGNLPPDHPYKDAAPTVWVPNNIAGLSGWYRADSLTGLNDGDPVSAWGDDSGLNRDMTEGSATLPTYKVGIQNSLPVVDFAGANFIGTPTASKSEWSFMHQQGTTVFVVYQTRENTRYGIIGTSGFSGNQRGYLLAANFANQGSILNYVAAGSGGTLLTPVQHISSFYVALPNVTNLLAATCNPTKAVASERSTHHINGTFRGANNTRTDAVVFGVPYLPLRMGLNGPSSNMLYLNGFIAEVVIYDSELSNEDRQTVEGYLAHKWGITANLPVDHPYKNEAP